MVGRRRRVALTVAGSDSSGGAGIVADLKVFDAYGVWGAVALSAVTAQNTLGVQASYGLPAELVRAQVDSVVSDLGVDALKTGILATAETVGAVADAVAELRLPNLVVDPVLAASQGGLLLEPGAVATLREALIPLATVVTPNLPEAGALLGRPVQSRGDMEAAATELASLGRRGAPVSVYLKGGHLPVGEPAADCLFLAGAGIRWFEEPRRDQPHTHGSGCVLSAAITAGLALGRNVADACADAKRFVTAAIAGGGGLGKGVGPVDPGAGVEFGPSPVS